MRQVYFSLSAGTVKLKKFTEKFLNHHDFCL